MNIPSTINLENAESYMLSIRIKPAELIFSISEPNIAKNYFLTDIQVALGASLVDEIRKQIAKADFLKHSYAITNIICVSQDYNIIPQEYFDEVSSDLAYNFIQLDEKDLVLSSSNSVTNTHFLYSMNKELYDFLNKEFKETRFEHHANLLLEYFRNKAQNYNESENKIYINFHADIVDIIAFDNNELKFCLSFKDKSINNQAYYILNLWAKSGFDQEKDHMFIYGNPKKELINRLQEYIRNINNIVRPSEAHLWGADALKAPLDILTLSL